jgi:integrase
MSIRLLRAATNWAIGEGLLSSNPCVHLNLGADGTRDLIVDDEATYRRLFATLDRMEQERRLKPVVADAIRLIALTGARRGEVLGLKWHHVHLDRGLLSLPAGAHKAGRRTGKPRVIGLPVVAQTIVLRQPKAEPPELVFASSRGGAISLSKPWRQVRVEADLPPKIGLHGLRHSFATHRRCARPGGRDNDRSGP